MQLEIPRLLDMYHCCSDTAKWSCQNIFDVLPQSVPISSPSWQTKTAGRKHCKWQPDYIANLKRGHLFSWNNVNINHKIFMVDFYGLPVGIYACPMDRVGLDKFGTSSLSKPSRLERLVSSMTRSQIEVEQFGLVNLFRGNASMLRQIGQKTKTSWTKTNVIYFFYVRN